MTSRMGLLALFKNSLLVSALLVTMTADGSRVRRTSSPQLCGVAFSKNQFGLLTSQASFDLSTGQTLHSPKLLSHGYQKQVYRARLELHPILFFLYRTYNPQTVLARETLVSTWRSEFANLSPGHAFVRREIAGLVLNIDESQEHVGLGELAHLRSFPLKNTADVLASAEALYRGIDALIEVGRVHTDLSHHNVVFLGPERAALTTGYAHLAIADLDALTPLHAPVATLSGSAPYFSPKQLDAILERRPYVAMATDLYWQASVLISVMRYGPSVLRSGSIRELRRDITSWTQTLLRRISDESSSDPLLWILKEYIQNGWSGNPAPLALRDFGVAVLEPEYAERVDRLHEVRHQYFQKLLGP